MPSLKQLALADSGGKAIPNHPVFHDGVSTTTYIPGGQPQRKQGELSQSEAKRHMEAYGGSEAIDWVSDCIDLYADTTSSAAWHLEKEGERYYLPGEKKPDGGKVVDKQLADLLLMPNPFMDYIELMQLLVIDLLLVGNAYWYKYQNNEAGRPLALYRLSPNDVKVRPGPYGIESYTYQPEGQKKKLNISPQDMVHFKRPNPHSPYYGLGVIRGGGRPLDLELSITDSQAHFFENKAEPSMIVQSERRVPRDVFRKINQQLRAKAMGTNKAGELLVLEAGLKASTLDRNARDAMYAELANSSRDRILAMFRVSPKLLGITEQGGGQDKVQDSRREFDNKVIRPFLDKLQSRITNQLIAAWGYDYKIDYKYIMPPEELVKLASDFGGTPGVMVKEIRRFLVEGQLLDEETTGDVEVDELVLNLPGNEADENGEYEEGEGFADRSLPREAGRTPKGENTRAIPRGSGKLPAGAQARRKSAKALGLDEAATLDVVMARIAALPKPDTKAVQLEAPVRSTVGNKLLEEQRPQDTLEAQRTQQIDAIVADMRDDIMDSVTTLERQLLDHSEGKAFESSTIVKRLRESEAWKSFRDMLGLSLEKGAREAAQVAGVQQLSAGFNPEDPIDYTDIARSVVYRPDGARGITDNLRKEIVGKVAKAVAEGGERGDVDGIIRESVDFWRQEKAEGVALTEAGHAYNESTLSIFELSGVSDVVVFDGEDHDDECAEANGEVWPISHARNNRLEHYRCRRAFTAAPAVS